MSKALMAKKRPTKSLALMKPTPDKVE